MSFIEKIKSFFQFEKRGTNFKKETLGGLVTFLAMSYILAVNPTMIGNAGVPLGGAFIATAVGAAIATIIMAFTANYPVALAPGMGVNAFFTYTIVLTIGYSWQEALAASFIGGLIFVAISFTSLRKKLIDAIPDGLKSAIGAGIGFFIAFVGLQNAGIIVPSGSTGVELGNLSQPTVLVALFGVLVIFALYNVKNKKISRFAFIYAILITAVLYVILALLKVPGIPEIKILSYSELGTFSDTFGGFITGFKTMFEDTPGVITAGAKLATLPIIVFALLFVDIFDTAGTLVAVTKAAGIKDENGGIPKLEKALFADAVGTLISSTMGTPEITSFVESATGVESGAKTGFSNLVVGGLFLLSVLLFPIMSIFNVLSVTSMALILVGAIMAQQIGEINWSDKIIAISSFMTIIGMVVTYSVSDGIAFGFITYTVSMLASGKARKIHPLIYIFSAGFILYFAFYSVGFKLF
ncbi:Xanthine/uracil/vitamin C permease [Alteracholeplasma palmae J233]|uniref:Xanthine/uracil/vitamin C permease n=1 Tax=Alteracholeplasma palmae (strain ATCC 49389 / J233) TaxID=1318466 RepID=U4KSA8_ALTPJ|nr:NCS2 family permease [Alteracholeplasma palmae]CCV64881.1 Xanthine/uracil/vitamin C permease [Alteracholeplasma palmae J233]